MSHSNPLAGAVAWIRKALPEPTDKDLSTQIGVHIEEFAEFLEQLELEDSHMNEYFKVIRESVHELATEIKDKGGVVIKDRVRTLDALCDNIQTAASVAHCAELDLVSGMNEVVDSNFSKFLNGTPLFDENRKVIKGPDYFEPVLTDYV